MFLKKITARSARGLTSAIIRTFLSETRKPDQNLVFIRHAQSEFNVACQQYRKRNGIPYVWKALCSHEGFDQSVLFNYHYVDCPLTEEGKQQCHLTREKLKNEKIDCILVSPQTRALETYRQIFSGRNIPTYVEPLLSGPIRSCCDLSRQTVKKLNQYPEINFRAMHEMEDLWFLDFLPFEQQFAVIQRLEQKNLKTFRERCEQLLVMLKEEKIYENALHYRKRIQKAKYRIAEYQSKFPVIAVVCHYYTIQYISAKSYQQCGAPQYYVDIQNCTPYYSKMSDLLSIKEEEEVFDEQFDKYGELQVITA